MTATSTATPPRKPIRWGRIGAWLLLMILLFITLFPFVWVLRTSFSSNASLNTNSTALMPPELSIQGYKRVFGLSTTQEAVDDGGSVGKVDFVRSLINSAIVATSVMVGQVLFCSMAAYAFARLRFPGRDLIFLIFLAGLLVPGVFLTLPNFILIKDLKLQNTLAGIALPVLLMTPFAVFFMRQFFLGINREIEEAAFIDGASRYRVFARIVVPMSAAPIATLALLTFIGQWNEYLWSQLVGGAKPESRVLTVALGVFRSQAPQTGPDWAGLMAASVVGAIPVVILLVVAGRKVVNSIGFSGIK